MLLAEVFDRPVNHADLQHPPKPDEEIDDNEDDEYNQDTEMLSTHFTIGDKKYSVELEHQGHGIWDLEFGLETVQQGRLKSKTSITKTGNAVKVFATVASIIKQFIRSHDVNGIEFSAKEASRRKLYDRLIKQFHDIGWKTNTKVLKSTKVYQALK